MQKQSLLDYLIEKTNTLDFDGELEWKWDKKHYAFKLGITLYAVNQNECPIVDVDEVISVENIITFYDEILLFDKIHSFDFNKKDYLVTLSFDGKRGWSQGKALAFLDTLQATLDNGESDLLDFANDESINVFELKWDVKHFKIETQKNKNMMTRLPYPKF